MTESNEHERCSELLPGYVTGALDDARAAGVERHLDSCAECTRELRAVTALTAGRGERLTDLERGRLHREIHARLSRDMPVASGSDGARAADGVAPGGRSRSERGRRLAPLMGAAALLLLLFGGVAMLTTGVGNSPSTGAGGVAATSREASPDKGRGAGAGGEKQDEQARAGDALGSPEAAGEGPASTTGRRVTARDALRSGPPPEPLFDRSAPRLTRAALDRLGRSGKPFAAITSAYDSGDARRLEEEFLDHLAGAAGSSSGALRACGTRVLASRGNLLPAYGARAVVDGRESLVLGFAAGTGDALDRFLIVVFPSPASGATHRCGSPRLEVSGTIGGE